MLDAFNIYRRVKGITYNLSKGAGQIISNLFVDFFLRIIRRHPAYIVHDPIRIEDDGFFK